MANTCAIKLILLFVIAFHIKGFAQLSQKHYIPPLTSSLDQSASPLDQFMYISTPSNTEVSYTIMPVGATSNNYISGSVSRLNSAEIPLGTGFGQLFITPNETSRIVNDKGFIIEASAPIYVSVRMIAGSGFQAGALVSKGVSALGTTFRVGTFTNENDGQSSLLDFVSVMATEDATEVNFSDLPSGIVISNFSGAVPLTRVLNKGESYTIATERFGNDINAEALIGCLVSSNKPIVVNCGSANGSFASTGARDYGIDQIVDVSKVNDRYIVVRGNGGDDFENVLVVAHTNNTRISINGSNTITTIDAGEHFVIEGDSYNNAGNMYIETSNPVFVYQGIGGTGSAANQGMFFVPPLSCETRGNIDNIPELDFIGNEEFNDASGISIVTTINSNITVRTSNSTNPLNIGQPSAVTGNTQYETYRLTGLTGNITVEGDGELYVAYFNVSGAATSGGFYSGFPSPPEISFDPQFQTLGNCIPNITLEASNNTSFDSLEWFFDDGDDANGTVGFQSTGVTTSTFTPTIPGRYKLSGTITCTGEILESAEIPLALCPDDTDNDGIIDNLDIDNDNDGILNCTESLGSVAIDLTNINMPILTFQDGTQNNSIATSSITNVTTGATPNDGDFTSTLAAGANTQNNFTLNFTESVNVRLDENTTVTHTAIEQEVFIAQILPSDQNITLIDPSNRLLVDSNFDGIFETGVTQLSGSEIRFKINPNPTGNTPYTFFANQVTGFTLIHEAPNSTAASTYNASISLSCFTRDSDGDGVKDEFDLDSDNDGVPDFIEHLGMFTPLSGTDSNQDGLDDVYDITATSVDTDNDGRIDTFDLDSDNDGITDLYETREFGNRITDANLDGIIDPGSVNFGTNGWADTLETTPDSGVLNTNVNLDPDGDTIPSHIDLDSEGDDCFDVFEAGFTDPDGNGVLGNGTPNVNAVGIVTSAADGYTIPNQNYLDAAPITITQQPENTDVCEFANTTVSLTLSTPFTTIQWQESTDGGATWANLNDSNPNFSDTQTITLNIINTPPTFNNNLYRTVIERNGNSCGETSVAAELNVIPLPVVNTNEDLVQCDDDDPATLGFSLFNLNEANAKISANAVNETFTFYETEAAARLGDQTNVGFISTPTAYENQIAFNDAIWVRIVNANSCFNVVELDLIVSTSASALDNIPVQLFSECDDFIDAANDDRDGFTNFNLDRADQIIRQEFISQGTPNLFPVYFESLEDALSETNAIADITNYRNSTPNTQTIYVRVDDTNGSNDCLGLRGLIELNVEALPVANTVTIPPLCDDDSNDGIEVFDTSSLEATLLGSQNPSDVSVTYLNANNQVLTNSNGTLINSPFPSTFETASQTITAVVTNINTADPDGPCLDETTITFTVNRQPIANPIADQVFCDGDAGDVDTDGRFPFDTSAFGSTVLGNQTGFDIRYNYTDENGAAIANSAILPNPLVSANQTLQIDILNPNNTTCVASTTVALVVNPLPEFDVESPRLVCSSDPTFLIDLEPLNVDPSETFTYEWRRSSLDNTVTNEFVSNTPVITVSTPGIYSITLTKTDGTNCSRTRDIVVDASEIANLTQESISIVDLSENNRVTIDTTNLGMGTYDFALQAEEDRGSLPNYQDSPVFNNVRAGFYTVFARDIICGTTTQDIAVIGHPRVFTPNGDGFNDLWQIRGISNTNQANSVIYIFDRYGKLLKQIRASSSGWDGTVRGQPLPTDDYWFKLNLEDGRALTGHFTLKR